MTGLKSVLSNRAEFIATRFPNTDFKNLNKLESSLALKYFSANVAEFDVAAFRERVMALSKVHQIHKLTKFDRDQLPWILFHDEKEKLFRHPALKEIYKVHLHKLTRSAPLKQLISAYLLNMDPAGEGWQEAGNLIRSRLELGGKSASDRMWRDRHEKYQLFDIKSGPESFASVVLGSAFRAETLMTELGITGAIRTGGFVSEAFRIATSLLSNKLRSPAAAHTLARYLSWIQLDKNFYFNSFRVDIAESLLSPWTSAKPELAIQQSILTFLMSAFGDPRLPNQGKWAGVSPAYVNVVKRWLAGQTLDAYFKLLTANSDRYQNEAANHWKHRHKFWRAYVDADAVDEAWVACADDVLPLAAHMFEDEFKSSCAQLRGNGVQPNHAILMLKVRGITIVEWSHNGKVRAWLPSNNSQPNFYKHKYTRNDVVTGSNKIVKRYQDAGLTHHSSEHGTWQKQLHDFIYDHTRLEIPERNYR